MDRIYMMHEMKKEHTKRRRNVSTPQGKKTSAIVAKNENVRCPLREEIADVLDSNNVFVKERPELEEDLIHTLEELATSGGDTGSAWKNVKKSILQLTNLYHLQAEDLSGKLVNRARELSLITKTNDSNLYTKAKLSKSNGPNLKFTNTSGKEVIEAPIKIQIQRKKKAGPELKPVTGFTYAADDEDTKDTMSMKIDIVSVPQDHRCSIIKKQLKKKIIKSVSNAINDAILPKNKKKYLKETLQNIIEKNLDKSALSQKQDISNTKQIMLNDINKILEASKFHKDTLKFLKYQIALILNTEFNFSLLLNDTEVKERLSKDLDEAINKLPISANEKNNLRHKLNNILSNDEIQQGNKEDTFKAINSRSFSFEVPQTNKQSTSKKIRQSIVIQDAFVPVTLQSNEAPEMSSEEAEKEYTEKMNQIIKSWVEYMEIDIDETVKTRLIHDWTGDIVDRKKYLQISLRTAPSEEEELDNLKYQVYKRLNKLVGVDVVTPIIHQAGQLLRKIQKVKVPIMIVPPGFHPRLEDDDEDNEPEKEDKKEDQVDEQLKKKREDKEADKVAENIADKVADKVADKGEKKTEDKVEKKREERAMDKSAEDAGSLRQKQTSLAPVFIENIKIPLQKDVTDILGELPDVPEEDEAQLEENVAQTLEKLAMGIEEPDVIANDVRKNQNVFTDMFEDEAEDFTDKLVDKDKEVCLITKIQGQPKAKMVMSEYTSMDDSIHSELEFIEASEVLLQKKIVNYTQENIGDVFDAKAWETQTIPTEARKMEGNITKNVDDWAGSLPLNIKDHEIMKDFENTKQDLISALKEIVPTGDIEKIKEAIKKHLLKMPIDEGLKTDEARMNAKVNELLDSLALMLPKAKDGNYGMSFNGLGDYIEDWMDNINIDDDTKTDEEIKQMKKDIAHDLTNKIGEMNIDPAIFNDFDLYEDVFRDEVNNMLDHLPITNENYKDLKEDLIQNVKEAHDRAHDEVAGQNYKQNLRDTMSRYLPDPTNLSPEEQANLELVKDQLADAFINLHHAGSDEELKDKLRKKIGNEIDKFCNDYLQRHPDQTIDGQQLAQELYNALQNLPLPPDDSMKYEVEQARIRDEINDWLKELPLPPQNPTDLLNRNKMVYVLAKKLFDIEKEIDDPEATPFMRKEIVKWLKKMPLKNGDPNNYDKYADKLIERLKATEESRKFNEVSLPAGNVPGARVPYASTPAVRIPEVNTPGVNTPGVSTIGGGFDDSVCPYYKDFMDHQPVPPCRRIMGRRPPYRRSVATHPPCTLSPEDLAHLERIRERACLSPQCISALLKGKRHTGVGPRPVDASSQTDLKLKPTQPESSVSGKPNQQDSLAEPLKSGKLIHPKPFVTSTPIHPSPVCPSARTASRPYSGVPMMPSNQSCYQDRRPMGFGGPCLPTDSRGEVQPHIIIKEYYWDSPENKFQEAVSQQPSNGPQQQPYPQDENYPQQQNYPQQRMPCDQMFPCPGSQPQRFNPYETIQQKSYQIPQNRSSHGSLPCSRPPCSSSPLSESFAPPCHQPTTPGGSYGYNDCRSQKRDGLQDQNPCSSRPRRERVIELGSLDDLRDPRPKKRADQFDWSYAKFLDEDNFWEPPCMKRVILDEGIDEPLLMEREKREERVRCKCKERLLPKCNRPRSRTCNHHQHNIYQADVNNLNQCSKCCGIHCPYPSYLYFRQ